MPNPIEIVVTASRIPNAIAYPSLANFIGFYEGLPPQQRDVEWLFSPYADLVTDQTGPTDPKRVVIDSTIDNYIEHYTEFRRLLEAVPNDKIINVGLGRAITGAELKAKIDGIRTIVTGRTYAPGYAGANYGDRFEIDYRQLGQYNIRGQGGINYLILHEIAHNTVPGIIRAQPKIRLSDFTSL